MKLLVAVFLTALSAVACAPVRIVESDVVTFVRLEHPIKFSEMVYSEEESFRLIDLSKGGKGVIFGSQPSGFMGVVVNEDLCFDQKVLAYEVNFGWYSQDILPPMTQNFCFKVERQVDLR